MHRLETAERLLVGQKLQSAIGQMHRRLETAAVEQTAAKMHQRGTAQLQVAKRLLLETARMVALTEMKTSLEHLPSIPSTRQKSGLAELALLVVLP